MNSRLDQLSYSVGDVGMSLLDIPVELGSCLQLFSFLPNYQKPRSVTNYHNEAIIASSPCWLLLITHLITWSLDNVDHSRWASVGSCKAVVHLDIRGGQFAVDRERYNFVYNIK